MRKRAYHADIDDLPRSLHSDNLKLAQTVLKLRWENKTSGTIQSVHSFAFCGHDFVVKKNLGGNVGSRCFSEAVVEKQLAAGLFSPFSFPLLPSLPKDVDC